MENFIAALAAECDPEIEACSVSASQDQFVRPPIDDFASVTLAYFLHPLASMLTFIVAAIFVPRADVGYEVLFYILVPGFAIYVN